MPRDGIRCFVGEVGRVLVLCIGAVRLWLLLYLLTYLLTLRAYDLAFQRGFGGGCESVAVIGGGGGGGELTWFQIASFCGGQCFRCGSLEGTPG